MRIKTKELTYMAIFLGVLMAFLWIGVGDPLETILGFILAWFIIPAFIPMIIAIVLLFVDTESSGSKKISNSIIFAVVTFVAYLFALITCALIALMGI